jgi:hypothetical protein
MDFYGNIVIIEAQRRYVILRMQALAGSALGTLAKIEGSSRHHD